MTYFTRTVALLRAHPLVAGAISLGIAALVVTARCNRGREAVAELARRDQAAPLEAAGAVVPKVADPDPEAARLLAENGSLRAEVERLTKVERSLRVKLAASLTSGPVVAGGAPRAAAPPPSGAASALSATPSSGPAAVAPLQPCLLAPGDTGEARAAALMLEGDKGARVLVADLGCYRTAPGPETRLFGGVARAPLSSAVEEGPPRAAESRWGFGPWVGASQAGIAYGAAVAAPQLHLWSLELDASAGGGVGPGGGQGSAQVIARF